MASIILTVADSLITKSLNNAKIVRCITWITLNITITIAKQILQLEIDMST